MKFVMTQSVCAEALALLQNKADVFVANDGVPSPYTSAYTRYCEY